VKRLLSLLLLVSIPFLLSCDGGTNGRAETVLGPDVNPQVFKQDKAGTTAVAVTGSGHYVNSGGNWRTMSFHVRQNSDGTVHGSFQMVLHTQPPRMFHGPLTCVSVVGNEAWIGGIYDKSYNPDLVGTGFGIYAQDNGQGANAAPDKLHRNVRDQAPEEWCSEMRDVSGSDQLYDIVSGNITIHR
jgi:hypothetical protein